MNLKFMWLVSGADTLIPSVSLAAYMWDALPFLCSFDSPIHFTAYMDFNK